LTFFLFLDALAFPVAAGICRDAEIAAGICRCHGRCVFAPKGQIHIGIRFWENEAMTQPKRTVLPFWVVSMPL